jgi:transposase
MTLDDALAQLDAMRKEIESIRRETSIAIEAERRENAELRAENRDLRAKIDILLKRFLSHGRERVDSAQLELAFEAEFGTSPVDPKEDEAAENAAGTPDDEETPATKRERRKKGGRRPLPEHLPVDERHVYPEESTCCGEAMKDAGVEVTEQLDFTPSSYKRLRTIKHKRACVVRDHNIVRPKPPLDNPIDRCVAATGLLAQVVVAKYADHLPLHRQVEIAARQGVELDKATMCGWLSEIDFIVKPIVRVIKRGVLASFAVNLDDTGVLVLDALASGGSHKGYLWVYHGAEGDEVFEYTETRKGEGPATFLKDYRGYVQADAASLHDGLFAEGSGRIEVGCWAHARRGFHDALSSDRQLALVAIEFIRRLYRIESEAKEAPPDARLALRKERSAPIITDFETWLLEKQRTMLPKSPFAQAVRYALNQWTALKRFLDHGGLPLDNNVSERGLRRVAVGRNNWTFAGSHEGAKRAATFYSLIATCKNVGVEPWAYLVDVLRRISTTPQSDVATLTPRGWKAARAAERQAHAADATPTTAHAGA